MQNNALIESLVLFILIGLSVSILNPFHFWMPDMVHESMLGALLVVFAVLAAFVVRERAVDEREVQLRMLGGRVGYLAGAAVLVLAILTEGLHATIDPWLIFALLAMLLGKLCSHFYTDRSR